MRYTKKLVVFMIIVMLTALSGCTSGDTPKTEDKTEASDTGLNELLGEYNLFATSYDDESLNLVENSDVSGNIKVYSEDGKHKADYIFSSEHSDTKYYGLTLSEESGEFSSDFGSSDRYYTLNEEDHPDDGYSVTYSLASTRKDTLTLQITTFYYYEDEDTNEPVNLNYDYYELYVKKGYKDTEQLEYDIRYKEKVTVSNITELYKEIGSGKHIVLKAGTYNISDLISENLTTFNRDYLAINGESIQIDNMNNILLEGESGALVHICTEDSYAVPLEFSYCENITLKNLTIGHEVEPGYCTGSVVKFNSCNYVNINKCNLYGSGTYGIEAAYTNSVKVNETDIYECTYGGIDLNDCYDWEFNDSKIRDSKEYSIIGLNGCGYIYFNRCEITDNYSGDYGALIDADDSYEVYFNGCTIKDNSYTTFLTGNSVYIKGDN